MWYVCRCRVSYLEIYNETMCDLLGTLPEAISKKEEAGYQDNMVVVENQDGVYVKGLSCHLAQTEEEALNLLFEVTVMSLKKTLGIKKNNAVFPLTWPTLFYGPNLQILWAKWLIQSWKENMKLSYYWMGTTNLLAI